MPSLNRMVVVVTAKQPFLDWLRTVDPTSRDLTLADLNQEPTAYLLPESGSDKEATLQVRRFCKEIFEAELDGWWRQRSDWPPNRTFGLFNHWFEWRYHSVVLDLAKEPLTREEV